MTICGVGVMLVCVGFVMCWCEIGHVTLVLGVICVFGVGVLWYDVLEMVFG